MDRIHKPRKACYFLSFCLIVLSQLPFVSEFHFAIFGFKEKNSQKCQFEKVQKGKLSKVSKVTIAGRFKDNATNFRFF